MKLGRSGAVRAEGVERERDKKGVLLLSEKRRRNLSMQMLTPFQISGTQIAGILCVEITKLF